MQRALTYFMGIMLACAAFSLRAQEVLPSPPMPILGPNDTIYVYATVYNGEWVPTSALPDVEVAAKMPRWMREQQKKWSRLRNAVYVTYPYAITASKVINEINGRLAAAPNERARKQIVKSKERELKEAFGDKITNLSVYQGKVLMKLINRQTGNNCYDILKEYKGGANARFWQTIAFVFGSNLKQPYEPQGADVEMEGIVKDVERMYNPWRG